ncbi:MAG: sn-glycerol-3-phosphate ABC transporter ATP-binding protein UgpC [Ignavibacteriales bacterium]|nr:sn-glycerol-3-phosphate ABC transporter ATP-binding protein UgpC [Ignavibacteriales bacterium]
MAEVELKHVAKIYNGKIKVVDDVNLKITDKEFVVLVGPSGCGKSTTLRMIAGLEEISEGEIFIDGKLVNDVAPKDRDIAMVFQNYALYPHMTVFENMAFGLKIRKFSKSEIKQRVEEASKILGLDELLNRKPKALSGGQRQRVALGRAIVRKPKVFLFDEPLSNLDAKLRVQMRTEISKLHLKLEATMIYVTHDQVEAMTMGDRIVVMKDGIIQQIDKPIDLYNNPQNKFVASFIGSPAMNFINGKIEREKKIWYSYQIKNQLRINLAKKYESKLLAFMGKQVILGIRPENFLLKNATNNLPKVTVEVEVVEPMGNDTFIYFNLDGIQFTARVISDDELKPKSKIDLYVNPEKLHFFFWRFGKCCFIKNHILIILTLNLKVAEFKIITLK